MFGPIVESGTVNQGSSIDSPENLSNAHPASSIPDAQQSIRASGDSNEGSPWLEKSKLNENNVLPWKTFVG